MTSKKLGGLLIKIVLFMSYFSKKLTFVSLSHKDLEKNCSKKKNIKILSENICIQLKSIDIGYEVKLAFIKKLF